MADCTALTVRYTLSGLGTLSSFVTRHTAGVRLVWLVSVCYLLLLPEVLVVLSDLALFTYPTGARPSRGWAGGCSEATPEPLQEADERRYGWTPFRDLVVCLFCGGS